MHTTSHTVASDNVPLYVLLGLLHFTRLVFFGLTAFVLVFSYDRRPRPLSVFWPKRFLLVGVPYLVWSFLYVGAAWLLSTSERGNVPVLVETYARGVVGGTAEYHLYFLLVTMQVYLLLPALLWLVRVTRRHHLLTVLVAFAVQLAILTCYKYFPHTIDWMHGYNKQFFITYIFFIVAGAVAADHAEAFLRLIRVHRRGILWSWAGVGVFTLLIWWVQRAGGQSLYDAGTPLQPIQALWSAAVFMAFLTIGARWADRRVPGSTLAKLVDYGSDRSFGIFLVHPFAIWLLLYGDSWLERHVPTPWLTPVTYVLVLLFAVAVTEVFRWTPLSVPLTGRPSLSSRASRAARAAKRSSRQERDNGASATTAAEEPTPRDHALANESDTIAPR